MAGLAYSVRDRSILLPHYKRFFVDPLVRLLPRRLDPNAITHVGHLVNLLGAVLLLAYGNPRTHGSWPFLVCALCLHLYNWCDNADGAHARRVGRCSAMGELLDHGLDLLNTTYVAYVSATAIDAPSVWWVGLAIAVPVACSATLWEQAETGLFSLGVLNQVESIVTLSIVLLVSAFGGFEIWNASVGPVSARVVVMGFVCAMALVAIAQNVRRVVRAKGRGALARILPLLGFQGAVMAALVVGAVAPFAAVVLATAANIVFGFRSLALRTTPARRGTDVGIAAVAVGALLVVGLVVWRLAGYPLGGGVDVAVSAVAIAFSGTLAVSYARVARRAVIRLDREALALRPRPVAASPS